MRRPGETVRVYDELASQAGTSWRLARIVRVLPWYDGQHPGPWWHVAFVDGGDPIESIVPPSYVKEAGNHD